MKRSATLLALVFAMSAARDARADDVAGAARAFSQAQQVMLSGDAAGAADLYELADELSPSAPALRNAARARMAANHHATAATLAAEMLRRYPTDKESRAVAEAILNKLTPELGQFSVACPGGCKILIDGKAVWGRRAEQHVVFIQPGPHDVVAVFDDKRRKSDRLTALMNHTTEARFEPPPVVVEKPIVAPAERVASKSASRGGISRKWAIGGAAITVGLGATAVVFGLQTLKSRDEVEEAIAANDRAAAQRAYDEGRDRQLRTNIFIGAAALAGAGTIVMSIFTDWSGRSGSERSIALTPAKDGGSVVYSGRF